MAFISSGYNPAKPMEGRITDIGPHKYNEYFPPVIKNNFGKWLYHEILEPGVLVHVAESGDKTKAAIASAETAALYGLEVLVPRINTDGDNTTRFIVISREKPTAGNRFSLLFTVDNKPGKLAEVIQVIGASGFNMESIKSRPMPHVPFEYYFYVELVGDPTADETGALLHELDRTCRTVRLLGVYTK